MTEKEARAILAPLTYEEMLALYKLLLDLEKSEQNKQEG